MPVWLDPVLGIVSPGIGSGSSTLLVAGYNSTPAVTGNNGYAIIDPTASTATAVGFTGTPPNAGDFRLGITFPTQAMCWARRAALSIAIRAFPGRRVHLSAARLFLTRPAPPQIAYWPTQCWADMPILAVQSIGDSHVSIYEVSNPGAPTYLASGNNTSGCFTANGNGTGELAWGATTDNGNGTFSQILYAMSTNQGIQAFVVTTPEPGTLSLVALLFGLGGLALHRRL